MSCHLHIVQVEKKEVILQLAFTVSERLQNSPVQNSPEKRESYFRNYAPAIFWHFWYPDSQPKSRTGRGFCQVRGQRNTTSLGCSSHKGRDLESSSTLASVTGGKAAMAGTGDAQSICISAQHVCWQASKGKELCLYVCYCSVSLLQVWPVNVLCK